MSRTNIHQVLTRLLVTSVDDLASAGDINTATPLAELGLSSLSIVNFLIAIEDEFTIEWSPETPRSAFVSIDTISRVLRDDYAVA